MSDTVPVASVSEVVPGFEEMLEYLGREHMEITPHDSSNSNIVLVAYPKGLDGAPTQPFQLGAGCRTYRDRVVTAFHVADEVKRCLKMGWDVAVDVPRPGTHGDYSFVWPAPERRLVNGVQLFAVATDRDVCEMYVPEETFGNISVKVVPTSTFRTGDVVQLGRVAPGGGTVLVPVDARTWSATTIIIPPGNGLGPGSSGTPVFNGRGEHIGIIVGEADYDEPGWAVVQLNVGFDARVLRRYARRKFFQRGRGKRITGRDKEDYERMREQIVAELGQAAWDKADYFAVGYRQGALYLEAISEYDGSIGVVPIDAADAADFLGGARQVADLVEDEEDYQRDRADRDGSDDGRGEDDWDVDDDDASYAVDDDFVIQGVDETDAGLFAWQTKTGGLAEQLASADREYAARVRQKWSGAPPRANPFDALDDEAFTPPDEEDDPFADLPVVAQKNRRGAAPRPELPAVTLTPRALERGEFPFERALSEDDLGKLEEARATLAEMHPTFQEYSAQRLTMKDTMSAAEYEFAMGFMDSYNNAKSLAAKLERRFVESGPNPGNSNWEAYDKSRSAIKALLAKDAGDKLKKFLKPQHITSAARTEKQYSLPTCYVVLAKRMLTTLNEAKSRLDYAEAQLRKESTAEGVKPISAHLRKMQELKAKLDAAKAAKASQGWPSSGAPASSPAWPATASEPSPATTSSPPEQPPAPPTTTSGHGEASDDETNLL